MFDRTGRTRREASRKSKVLHPACIKVPTAATSDAHFARYFKLMHVVMTRFFNSNARLPPIGFISTCGTIIHTPTSVTEGSRFFLWHLMSQFNSLRPERGYSNAISITASAMCFKDIRTTLSQIQRCVAVLGVYEVKKLAHIRPNTGSTWYSQTCDCASHLELLHNTR